MGDTSQDATALPKIYCWINAGSGTEWVIPMAMAEDGNVLASHCSSNDSFARWDVGYGAGAPWDDETDPGFQTCGPYLAKREKFKEHYPDGYEVVWVDNPRDHEGLTAAVALNKLIGEAAEKQEAGPDA